MPYCLLKHSQRMLPFLLSIRIFSTLSIWTILLSCTVMVTEPYVSSPSALTTLFSAVSLLESALLMMSITKPRLTHFVSMAIGEILDHIINDFPGLHLFCSFHHILECRFINDLTYLVPYLLPHTFKGAFVLERT